MSSLFELFENGIASADGSFDYVIPESWMQGRAIYGGLSTALCVDGAIRLHPDLPPLRSVCVNFVGPASDNVTVRTKELRRGKSVVFIQSDLFADDRLITTTVLGFGQSRDSKLDFNYGDSIYGDKREVPPPEQCRHFHPQRDEFDSDETYQRFSGLLPRFVKNFDVRLASGSRPFEGSEQPSFEVWVKYLKARPSDLVSLVALADMPPPAILPLLRSPANVSSMSWMFNILSEDLSNESGWWLLGSFAEHARSGYSSQNMTIHNDRGELIVTGRQNITVFY